MIRQHAIRQKIYLFLLMLFFWISCLQTVSAAKSPTIHTLDGLPGSDPLIVTIYSDGNLSVSQWDESTPGWGTYEYVNRYFDGAYWGTVLFLNRDDSTAVFASNAFGDRQFAVSQAGPLGMGEQVVSADNTSVTTSWEPLAGLTVSQTIVYESKTTVVNKQFAIHNNTDAAISGLRLLHGGILAYTGDVFQPLTITQQVGRLLTIAHQDSFNPRQVQFEAGPESPWDNWQAGEWTTVMHAMEQNSLNQSAQSPVLEPACFVGWTIGTLASGAVWTGETHEDFAVTQTGSTPTPEPTVTADPTASATPEPVLSPTPDPTGTASPTTTVSTGTHVNETTSSAMDPTGTTAKTTGPTTGQTGTQEPAATSEDKEMEPIVQTGETRLPVIWPAAALTAGLILLAIIRRRVKGS